MIKTHPVYGIQVSDEGKVCVNGRWTYGACNSRGYLCVSFIVDGKYKTCSVHRLIAETFIENPESKPTVDHIDRDRTNNQVDNLRWATRKEQQRNTKLNDQCKKRFGFNTYENPVEYNKLNCKEYYHKNSERINDGKKTKEYRDYINTLLKDKRANDKEWRDEKNRKQREYRRRKKEELNNGLR